MLGTILQRPIEVNQSDSAELRAYLMINGQPVTQDQILGVDYIVQKPDGTSVPQPGEIEPDGAGFLRWFDTQDIGEYIAQAQFTLGSGEIRSVMTNFVVCDPFHPPEPTMEDWIIDQVSMRLEDCFDSAEGGPWLRDQTMARFDATKIEMFIPEALLDINAQMPPTNYDIGTFANPPGQNPNMPILVKGVLILVMRHLMRSYVEQPVPQGGQVVWHDRTRYQQAWGQIYQLEYADYISTVRLWKRTALRLGSSALLTFSKAGRLYPYGSMRSRGISRGYY